MNPKALWTLFKDTFVQWSEDNPFQLAAALSYYTLFSLAPLSSIAIGIAGFVFGHEAAQNEVIEALRGTIGPEAAEAFRVAIQRINRPTSNVLSTGIGLTMLLFGAGGVVGQLQTSLNTIWGVMAKSDRTWGDFFRDRFVSFAMVLGIGFVLLVSLLLSAVLSRLTAILGSWLGNIAMLAYLLDVGLSFALVTLLFAMLYRFLPDVRIDWKDVWIGAALTSLLFSIGKSLIAVYLAHSAVASPYGAAGFLITLLLWVYYSSLIFFFGAEFTQVYSSGYGSGVIPAKHAQTIAEIPECDRRHSPPPEERGLAGDRHQRIAGG